MGAEMSRAQGLKARYAARVTFQELRDAKRARGTLNPPLSPSGEPYTAEETFAEIGRRIAQQPESPNPYLVTDISQLPKIPLK